MSLRCGASAFAFVAHLISEILHCRCGYNFGAAHSRSVKKCASFPSIRPHCLFLSRNNALIGHHKGMKTIFPYFGKQTPTLKQRRNTRQIRTVLGALCAGLAVFSALQSIAGTLTTKSAVAATHNISRGHTISISDTKQVQIAESPALSAIFSSCEEAKGLVAQVDIAAGSVIMQPMARPTPMITHGETVIGVRMSGSQTSLIPGDKVSLVGSAGCESVPNPIVQQPGQQPNQDSNASPADAGTDEYSPNDVSNGNHGTPNNGPVPIGINRSDLHTCPESNRNRQLATG